jgi:hypothetical protein
VIRLTQAQANDVTVTLTEVGTASHYLFAFTSEATQQTVYCVADDTSPYQARYNQFTITEVSASPDPLAAEVTLFPTGQWYYHIYANTNATNLDPTGLTLLERGICIVSGAASTITMPTYSGGNVTAVVYEPA